MKGNARVAGFAAGAHLRGLHVKNFGDASLRGGEKGSAGKCTKRKRLGRRKTPELPTHLHDQEVRVVHVELDRVEEVLHADGLGVVAVDEVLVAPANDDLAVDGDFIVLLVADLGTGGVGVKRGVPA